MNIEHILPQDIEKRSFEIIGSELDAMGIRLPEDKAFLIKRAIHTTADFEFARTLWFSDHAIETAEELLRNGADIVTDTNMTLSGINKPAFNLFGGEAHCYMAQPDVAEEAKARGITRASVSMERAAALGKPVIFAIGNAPTALITLRELFDRDEYHPDFVIGVPVGFVNVEYAKELIVESRLPCIVNRGRKGGSNVAAAICNALLYDLRSKL